MTDSIKTPIEQPIERQHTGKGITSAMNKLNAGLTNRQKELLNALPNYDSRITVPKNKANMYDLAALTAQTGVEYAMFTKGGERLIIRGNEKKVNVDERLAAELSANGYRWSGHTHPEGSSLMPSDGDVKILNQFKNQLLCAIYNTVGDYDTFGKG